MPGIAGRGWRVNPLGVGGRCLRRRILFLSETSHHRSDTVPMRGLIPHQAV